MDLEITNELTESSDINKLCRTCLNAQNDMIPIFNECFVNMLVTCTNVKVLIGDGLPCNICVTCRKLLYLSYFFKRRCEKAHLTLNNYLHDQKAKIITSGDISENDKTTWSNNDSIKALRVNDIPSKSLSPPNVDDILKGLIFHKNKIIYDDKETQTELIYSSNVQFEYINEFNIAATNAEPICTTDGLDNAKTYMMTRSSRHAEEKRISCTICKENFMDLSSLQDHEIIHKKSKRVHARNRNGSLSNVCTECNKTFRDQKCLQRHMKIHNGIKSHMCTLCGKAFLHSETLETHMRSHTGEKPYECTFCQKSFMTSSNLVVHRRRHTGERPYQCSVCQKSFISSGILKQHELVHSGEKRYSCSVCGKRVARQYDLTTHMRSHSGEKPYSCALCKKKFATSSHLAVHKRKHKDERNYVCPTCGKAFMESGVLKSHLRVHSGEKPYQCTLCDKAFSQSGSLSSHMKGHHHLK